MKNDKTEPKSEDWNGISKEQWRTRLGEERYHIAREGGTERAFTGRYWDCKTKGMYHCAACGAELFASEHKYDSGTGWPSFDRPVSAEQVVEHSDNSHGMQRVEVLCHRCSSHLGHVFEDGPPSTGRRYCINSAVLDLKPGTEPDSS